MTVLRPSLPPVSWTTTRIVSRPPGRLAKGAWAALFGGPGYLVAATAAGWSVSGFAAFCAVAAFVAGFAILVLRMHDSDPNDPGGPDDGDDGAVV